jgi:hypothetical protein
MDGLLRHWDKQLAQMTPSDRAEVAQGLAALFNGARVAFRKLRGGGVHFIAAMGWIMRQASAERTGPEFAASLRAKAEKAGPHVMEVVRYLELVDGQATLPPAEKGKRG